MIQVNLLPLGRRPRAVTLTWQARLIRRDLQGHPALLMFCLGVANRANKQTGLYIETAFALPFSHDVIVTDCVATNSYKSLVGVKVKRGYLSFIVHREQPENRTLDVVDSDQVDPHP